MKKILLFTIILLANTSIFAQTPNDDVVRYTFDNKNLNNEADSGFSRLERGDYSGKYTKDRNGKDNSAFDVNGEKMVGATLSRDLENLTVSFWLKSKGTTRTSKVYILEVTGDNRRGFRFYQEQGSKLGLYINSDGSNSTSVYKDATLNGLFDEKWHNVVLRATKNKNDAYKLNIDVFIDGTRVSGLSAVGLPISDRRFITNNATFKIANATSTYRDELDDIRIYERSLTDNEVESFYEEPTAGIAENINFSKSIKIVPNPVEDRLNVISNKTIKRIEIFDLLGKKIIKSDFKKIDVSSLKSGIYIVKIAGKNDVFTTKKIIKQ